MNATATNGLTTGTRRTRLADDTYRYTGLIRHHGTVIAECGHEHTNRDQPRYHTPSARTCAERILDGARRRSTADRYATEYRDAWKGMARAMGGSVKAGEKAKATAAAHAAHYLAAVDTVRALLDPNIVDMRTEAEILAYYQLPL